MGEYMTTSEVCKLLGLKPARVKQLKCELGATKLGRDLLYPRAKVLAYQKAPRRGPGRPPKPAP